jgi:hypothetical protein
VGISAWLLRRTPGTGLPRLELSSSRDRT